jgi:hypothetical protein
MDNPISPARAMLYGMAFGLAPDLPNHGNPRGHECPECHQTLGHSDTCVSPWIERLAKHVRDHQPCKKLAKQLTAGNGDGLCPRARRLFDKANALGDASDAEYEKKMGGKIGGSRKSDDSRTKD